MDFLPPFVDAAIASVGQYVTKLESKTASAELVNSYNDMINASTGFILTFFQLDLARLVG